MAIVDTDTGEVIEKGARFFMVNTRLNMFLDKRLTLSDLRVLAYCCQVMLKDGHILETQQRIAERMSMHKSNVSSIVRRLRSYGFLLTGQYKGRRVLRVNPEMASKRSRMAFVDGDTTEEP